MDPVRNIADKALDKIPTDKVYEDLLQPVLRKAGEALATVMDLGNTILFPVQMLNERRKIILKENLQRYEAKLQARNKETIPVPDSIAIPIVEKLSYVSQQEISEAFINLLTKASFSDTVSAVHPAFITAINNISADEAKLLFALKGRKHFPLLNVVGVFEQNGKSLSVQLGKNLTGLELVHELEFPKNIDLYLENLEILGIFQINQKAGMPVYSKEYELIESQYKDPLYRNVNFFLNENTPSRENKKVKFNRLVVDITEYGRSFSMACMEDVKDSSID
ncbi:Abi-alpha family protein [Dyadobacter diqingensis]|uniref:Abi-alpha family protein n=1 Tax=Dyadobacter diqingensis TaxID=2938121 RepID=UPI0020C497F0|nr:Abi-alpha family protein [Dyadobacter diqingensis]